MDYARGSCRLSIVQRNLERFVGPDTLRVMDPDDALRRLKILVEANKTSSKNETIHKADFVWTIINSMIDRPLIRASAGWRESLEAEAAHLTIIRHLVWYPWIRERVLRAFGSRGDDDIPDFVEEHHPEYAELLSAVPEGHRAHVARGILWRILMYRSDIRGLEETARIDPGETTGGWEADKEGNLRLTGHDRELNRKVERMYGCWRRYRGEMISSGFTEHTGSRFRTDIASILDGGWEREVNISNLSGSVANPIVGQARIASDVYGRTMELLEGDESADPRLAEALGFTRDLLANADVFLRRATGDTVNEHREVLEYAWVSAELMVAKLHRQMKGKAGEGSADDIRIEMSLNADLAEIGARYRLNVGRGADAEDVIRG